MKIKKVIFGMKPEEFNLPRIVLRILEEEKLNQLNPIIAEVVIEKSTGETILLLTTKSSNLIGESDKEIENQHNKILKEVIEKIILPSIKDKNKLTLNELEPDYNGSSEMSYGLTYSSEENLIPEILKDLTTKGEILIEYSSELYINEHYGSEFLDEESNQKKGIGYGK